MPDLPLVKICGVCDPSDARMAVAAGASHIGVIRVPGSRRTRPAEVAREVCVAGAGARRVGVYVDAPTATIVREADQLGLDVVQLHGSEEPQRVRLLRDRGFEVWKVVKPGRAEELLDAAYRYRDADLLLVEGASDRGPGGVGARFPWAEVAAAMDRLPPRVRIGVAGGLTAENVGRAVRRFRPALVDVSSGVESSLGHKNGARVRAFIAAVHAAAGGR